MDEDYFSAKTDIGHPPSGWPCRACGNLACGPLYGGACCPDCLHPDPYIEPIKTVSCETRRWHKVLWGDTHCNDCGLVV
jgi:hypothetical protein